MNTKTVVSLSWLSKGYKSDHFELDFRAFSAFSKTKENILRCLIKDPISDWIFDIEWAQDCHNYNLLLSLDAKSGWLFVQVVKNIAEGDRFTLWFSADILQIMNIKYLKLINIVNEKQYWCDKCYHIYEFPNPLKLHIALKCNRRNVFDLWHKLSTKIKCLKSNENLKTVSANRQQHGFDRVSKVSKGNNLNSHLCTYCGKCYSRKYGLKIHVRTHTGYKPLRCRFCQRAFGDPSNLNKHIRLHIRKTKESSLSSTIAY